MGDLLGRQVKIGDLVVYNNTFYLVLSDSQLFRCYTQEINSDFYLIDKPSVQEIKIKKELERDYFDYVQKCRKVDEEKKNLRQHKKKIATQYSVGDILMDSNRYRYALYLGQVSYTDLDGKVYTGHGYIPFMYGAFTKNVDISKFKDFDFSNNKLLSDFIGLDRSYSVSLGVSLGNDCIDKNGNLLVSEDELLSKCVSDFHLFKNRGVQVFKNPSTKYDKILEHINLSGNSFNALTNYTIYNYFNTRNAYRKDITVTTKFSIINEL